VGGVLIEKCTTAESNKKRVGSLETDMRAVFCAVGGAQSVSVHPSSGSFCVTAHAVAAAHTYQESRGGGCLRGVKTHATRSPPRFMEEKKMNKLGQDRLTSPPSPKRGLRTQEETDK